MTIRFQTRKRAAPTMTYYAPDNGAVGVWHNISTNGHPAAAAQVAAENGVETTLAAGTTQEPYRGHWTASAEL